MADGASCEGLLEQLETTLLSSGRKTTAFAVDGQACEAEDLEKKCADGASELAIETRPLEGYLLGVLSDMEQALKQSQDDASEMGEQWTKIDLSEGIQALEAWLSDVQGTCQSLTQLVQMLGVAPEALVGDSGVSLSLIYEKVDALCFQFKQALADENMLKVADLCETEAVQLLDGMLALLPKVKSKVSEAFGLKN